MLILLLAKTQNLLKTLKILNWIEIWKQNSEKLKNPKDFTKISG